MVYTVSSSTGIARGDGNWTWHRYKVGQDWAIRDTNADAVLGSNDIIGITDSKIVHPFSFGYYTADTTWVASFHEVPKKGAEVGFCRFQLVQIRQAKTDGFGWRTFLDSVKSSDGFRVLAGGPYGIHGVCGSSNYATFIQDSSNGSQIGGFAWLVQRTRWVAGCTCNFCLSIFEMLVYIFLGCASYSKICDLTCKYTLTQYCSFR